MDHCDVLPNQITKQLFLNRTQDDIIHIWATTDLENWLRGQNMSSWAYSDNPFPKGTRINTEIPHEVVGKEEMHLFLVDNKSDLYTPSNIMALTHGMGHVMLKAYDPERMGTLIVNDLSGNKAGKTMKWYVTAVHNRTNTKGNTYLLRTYRWFGRWKKQEYWAFDFRRDL